MSAIDLTDVPLIDNHCHGVYRDPTPMDLANWRGLLTESAGPETRREFVTTSLVYQRLIRHLARYFGCENTDDAVVAARAELPVDELTSALLRDARFDALVMDTGLPPADQVYSHDEMQRMGNLRVAPLLRVEIVMQDLIVRHDSLQAVKDGLQHALADVRAQGFVGLKTIVAYRTGLDIRAWTRDDAEASFAEAREEVEDRGFLRLAHKPLLDTLLHVVFAEASRQELPVQFHTGYGDTDADMILANPLYLREVLDTELYRGMFTVLLHESYPYVRQGGYMAALYDRVYLDLSYAIPYLGYRAMETFTREAFGVAPYAKLLYSSDGVWIPELHWMSAIDGRRILGTVLGEIVESGDLTHAEAERAGVGVLRENAARLYGI